ncbi:MAG: hypothetical protein ACREE7_20020, partial [Dongiaceae bacterium]
MAVRTVFVLSSPDLIRRSRQRVTAILDCRVKPGNDMGKFARAPKPLVPREEGGQAAVFSDEAAPADIVA